MKRRQLWSELLPDIWASDSVSDAEQSYPIIPTGNDFVPFCPEWHSFSHYPDIMTLGELPVGNQGICILAHLLFPFSRSVQCLRYRTYISIRPSISHYSYTQRFLDFIALGSNPTQRWGTIPLSLAENHDHRFGSPGTLTSSHLARNGCRVCWRSWAGAQMLETFLNPVLPRDPVSITVFYFTDVQNHKHDQRHDPLKTFSVRATKL